MNDAVKNALTGPPERASDAATIEMPARVMVRCPLVDFGLRSVAKHCPPCPHFRGLADRFPGMEQYPTAKRYFVLCAGAPTKRELMESAE